MKKVSTFILVLFTFIPFMLLTGCGGSSSNPVAPDNNLVINDELILGALGNKSLDFDLKVALNASISGNKLRFSGLDSYKIVVYKLSDQLVKDKNVKHTINDLTDKNGYL